MADIHCPLCGKKNWLPDGAESTCFYCGSPLSPETEPAQEVQYAPLPEPEKEPDESPLAKAILDIPFLDPFGGKDAPSETDAEAQIPDAPQEPCTPVNYRMTDMIDQSPEEACPQEKKEHIKRKFRQWVFMNTVFLCMQACLSQMAFYYSKTNNPLLLPVMISCFVSMPVLCLISDHLCPVKGWDSFVGIMFTGSFFTIFAGALVGGLGLGLALGSVLAASAGAGISALLHYGGRRLAAEEQPCTPVQYRMTDLPDLLPEDADSPEQKVRAKRRYRRWFLMNTAFICLQAYLIQIAVFLDRTNSALEALVGLLFFVLVPVLCLISSRLCPKQEERFNLIYGSVYGILAGGALGKIGIDLSVGAVLAVAAGTAISALVHFGRRLLK